MNLSTQAPNPDFQQLQRRVHVREQEINALKVQNRHLLEKLDQAEANAKPNVINTQFIADEVQKQLAPVIDQLQLTITNSFEILQSTMRGIYQQSQRAEHAVEEMASHSRDLEIRMNEQRKGDQNFYQDKIFSMIGTFCNRIERQIEIRFKALSSIELMNTKQNEVLSDVERMRVALENINLYYQESADKLNGVQLNARSSKEMTQNLLQQMQNQRAEFKLIRSELNTALDIMNAVPYSKQNRFKPETNDDDVFASVPIQKEEIRIERDPSQIIDDLIEKKHIELNELEKNTENQDPEKIQDNAAELLSLIRAQHNEIQRVADDAKQFLKGTMKQIKNKESPQEVAQSSTQESEQNTDPEVS